MVDQPSSRYPHTASGQIASPSTADWLDPMIGLRFAAAATSTIQIATGVLLLPEHNPIVVAKQAATLDVLSGGRLILGAGVGWAAEEFAALGRPFERRASRTREYVDSMRTIWRDDVGSFQGGFVHFDAIRVNPKPMGGRTIPIVLGGNFDAALRRVAQWGDGGYGFNLDGTAEVAQRVGYVKRWCREAGRDASDLHLAVSHRPTSPRPSRAGQPWH